MDAFNILVAGVLLAIASVIVPKSRREKIGSFINFPIFNFGASEQQGENEPSIGSSFSADPTTQPQQIIVQTLPRNRTLTELEVRALARYVKENFGFNATEKGLVSIAWIESSFRPWVERDEGFDKSTGLMQTLLGTARDLHSKGYTHMGMPTAETLKTPLVSMYFGAAYVDWLKKHWAGRSSQWYARAYNGGPGWEGTPNGEMNTAVYYQKFLAASSRFSLSITAG